MKTKCKYELVDGCYKVTINKYGENEVAFVHVKEGEEWWDFSLSFWHPSNERIHCWRYFFDCYTDNDAALSAYIEHLDFYYKL